jgi:aerobic C4-dicarboxylate transport protein
MAARLGILRSLYVQVLIAIAVGVTIGYLYPETGAKMQPLAQYFINTIKLLIPPIIFCTVVLGIAGMEELKHVGKAGGFALLYFEVVSTLALIVGLVIVNVVRPGAGMNVDVATLDAKSIAQYTASGTAESTTAFVLTTLEKSPVLLVLLFSVVFGFALHFAGGRGTSVFQLIERFSHLMFRIIGIIMRFAPIAAFGAMAFVIGKYGIATLAQLGALMACFYATCLLFILGVLGVIARVHGFRITRFIRYIKDELLIVLGTSSSESVLPRMISKLEGLGVQKSVVGLVIPTGYSFNLDGTSIYLTMAAVFIAQATNTPLTLWQQITLLIVLLLTSKGAAGVTGSGFIVLAATLSAVGHVPVAGLALIVGIDRFMSEARALTNLIGNGVATIVVGKWCACVDEAKLQATLAPASAELKQALPP